MTDAYSFDDARTRLGSRAAVVIATVAAGVLGATAGYPVQTLLAIVGGLTFGVAARDVAADDLRDRVRGSTLLVLASTVLVVALVLRKATFVDAVLVSAVAGAIGMTTLAATTDPDESVEPVFAALSRSFVATFFGTLLASMLYADVFLSITIWTVMVASAISVASPMFGFVLLQFELLCVGLLATHAGRAAATFDSTRSRGDVDVIGVRDVPKAVWALLGVQVFVAALPGGSAPFEFLLATAGPVGALVGAVLRSAYLHGALLALALVLATLPVAAWLRRVAVSTFGSRAPKSLAFATGGVVLSAVVVVVTSIPGFTKLVLWLAGENESVTKVVNAYGVGPAVLAAVSGVLVVMGVVLFFYMAAFGLPFVPEHASGFVFAAATLFVAAVAGAFAGAPAPAVFVAMAATLSVWDVGEYAITLGEELGQAASTRSVGAVHVLATVAVGAIAVVVAALATHFFVPVMTHVPEARALTALGLLSVALVAFAYLANTSESSSTNT